MDKDEGNTSRKVGEVEMRLIDADDLKAKIMIDAPDFMDGGSSITKAFIMAMLGSRAATPTIDAVQVVRCKDCKHRPIKPKDYTNGFDLEFPDDKCPCKCEDGWYSWYPKDNWFCANGE